MYTASGSLRLHLKSHLSRLAANAFSSMNLPGFSMGQNGSLSTLPPGLGPQDQTQTDFKFGIKQEVFETSETTDARTLPENSEEILSTNTNLETKWMQKQWIHFF